MKTIGRIALAALLIGIGTFGRPAYAQFSNVTSEQGSEEATSPTGKLPPLKGFRSTASLSFFPVAPFASSGGFATGVQGTQTNYGMLLDGELEVSWKRGQGKEALNRVGLGGYYWSKGSGDLYQIHQRVFFSEQFGIQTAYLSSSSSVALGPSYTFFFLYDLNSRSLFGQRGGRERGAKSDKRTPRPFNIELGLGTYIDPTGQQLPNGGPEHRLTTLGFSTFISGTFDMGKRVSLIASQWYVRDRTADLTRFALGVGYRF